MKFEIYQNGTKINQLSYWDFVDFYYSEFGNDCGNPKTIADSLTPFQGTYVGKGYTVFKSGTEAKQEGCQHTNKFLNIVTNSLQFWVCKDCKQEV